jgi:hypothetical protein
MALLGWNWFPHGWWTVAAAVGLLLFVIAYLGFGPPGVLAARVGAEASARRIDPPPKLPESGFGTYNALSLEAYLALASRPLYRNQLKWDLLFALMYGVGLVVVLEGTLRYAVTRPGKLWWVICLPLCAVIADLCEDVLLLVATRSKPVRGSVMGPARASTALKTTFVIASAFAIAAGAVILGIRGHGG